MTIETDDELRILHVDNNLDSLESVAEFFEEGDNKSRTFSVFGVDEPAETVERIEEVDPDAVISEWDYELEEVTGVDVLEDVNDEYGLPFLFYAQGTNSGERADAIGQGAYDFVEKSEGDNLEVLGAKVEQAVANNRKIDTLESENDRLQSFVSVVSHDLRNPLSIIEGYIEQSNQRLDALRSVVEGYEGVDQVDEEVLYDAVESLESYQETIGDSSGRMRDIIDDALEYARVGGAVEETSVLNIREVAQECWDNVETYDGVLESDPKHIEADKSRLKTLFENLYRNSFDHGGEDVNVEIGGISAPITTSTRVAEEQNRGFYIQDDGPGIPEDERDEVIEEGYTKSDDGTGFGLAIVQEVVDAHDWEMEIEESPYGGARFEIYTE